MTSGVVGLLVFMTSGVVGLLVIVTSELVDRNETSKLKDAPRILPARQNGERLFWVFMSSELSERLPGADARELRCPRAQSSLT